MDALERIVRDYAPCDAVLADFARICRDTGAALSWPTCEG